MRLYGEEITVPNMYLHAHIHECIEDFGPVQSFWHFSFKRLNGLLGKRPLNNKSIEVQVMRQFLRDTKLMHLQLPTEFPADLSPLCLTSIQDTESGSDPKIMSPAHLEQMSVADLNSVEWNVDLKYFKIPTNLTRYVLTPDEYTYLSRVYSLLHPEESITAVCTKVHSCEWTGFNIWLKWEVQPPK